MKAIITSAPVLIQPDIEKARDGSRPFVICTDASGIGLGAVLSQEGDDRQLHPVYFASKGLSMAERRYHVTDLEALAVVFALRRFHMFIYGLPTIVLTDHQPLTALFRRSNVSARVLRWSLEVQRYNLEIKYLKGKTNVVADALSRGAASWGMEESIQGLDDAVVNAVAVQGKSKWLEELEQDEDFADIISYLRKGSKDAVVAQQGVHKGRRVADFKLDDGELKMYQPGKLVLVVPKSVRYTVFQEAHGGTFAGHFSAHKVVNQLKKEVFWPSVVQDVHKWTGECQRCFVHNPRSAVVPPLKPIITSKPFEVVGIDILELGPTTSGNRYAVPVIDHFSKFAAAYPVADKSAETVARTFFTRWIAEGCRWPKTILSDKGGEFENKVMAEIMRITKVEHMMTKGYNPRENGITERLNGTIVAMLRRSTVVPAE
ncbi:integrase core domain protein [Ancylostoma ceylanicum]|uniref:RNA-directed DNA polymerase n=1 Tax=Ancylostoma ceylanicum TaxID=53326 RepID=A0A0D6LLK7_9BILA|nr:integrase core domain protein [Ancylostoma ceylanicum]